MRIECIFVLIMSLMISTQESVAQDERASAMSTRLAPGNALSLISAVDISLNSIIELDWQGEADLPLCGKKKLAGLTLLRALNMIESCLKPFFRKSPQLALSFISPKLYLIQVGMRNEPKVHLRVPDGISVRSIIANQGINISDEMVLRLLSPHGLDIVLPVSSDDWNRPHLWLGGESIILEKRDMQHTNYTVDVLGEVRKPGKFNYRPSLNILSILSEAQGPTPLAAPEKVQIFRATTGKKIETSWDDQSFKIEPGDSIFVPPLREGGFDKGMRWTSSALAIINTLFLILIARRE